MRLFSTVGSNLVRVWCTWGNTRGVSNSRFQWQGVSIATRAPAVFFSAVYLLDGRAASNAPSPTATLYDAARTTQLSFLASCSRRSVTSSGNSVEAAVVN